MPIQNNTTKNAEYYIRCFTDKTYTKPSRKLPKHWLTTILEVFFFRDQQSEKYSLSNEIETFSLSSMSDCEVLTFYDLRKRDNDGILCPVLVRVKNGDDVTIHLKRLSYTTDPKTDADQRNNQIFVDDLNRYLNHVEMLNEKEPLTLDNLNKHMPTIDQDIHTPIQYLNTNKPLLAKHKIVKSIIDDLLSYRCVTTLDQVGTVVKAFDKITPQQTELDNEASHSRYTEFVVERPQVTSHVADVLFDTYTKISQDQLENLLSTDLPITVRTSGPPIEIVDDQVVVNFYYCNSVLINMLRRSERLNPTMTKSSRVIGVFNIPIEFVFSQNAQKVVEVSTKFVKDARKKGLMLFPGYKSINKTDGVSEYLDKQGRPNTISFLDVLDADDIVIVD